MNNEHLRCKKCILSISFPGISVDEEGICNFCRDQTYFTTENQSIEKAKKIIDRLLTKEKGKHEYDALVCYSGGKDSTYTLLKAVNDYGMSVLALTLDNGFLSERAKQNINIVIDNLGVDLITIKPSSNFFNALALTSAFHPVYPAKTLSRISSVCFSCISLVNLTALKTALEKGIPFIVSGFTLGQIPANSIVYRNNYNFFKESREKHLAILRKYLGDIVNRYFYLSQDLLSKIHHFPYNINLLCLENPTEKQILSRIKTIGWKYPEDVDGCSSNCLLNGFNNLIHYKTLGYNPYELELSHLIRHGKISRNEALVKINKQTDPKSLDIVLKKLGASREDIENFLTNEKSLTYRP